MARKKRAEFHDVFLLRGCIEMQLGDKHGNPVGPRVKSKNTVVTAGRSWVLSRIKSTSPAAETISHVAIGTDNTAPTTAQTALGNESTRIAISNFTTTGLSAATPSWRAEATFATDEGNTTIQEAGLFNSSSAGTMLSRVTFGSIDKTTSNTLAVSYTISN